MPPQRSVVYKVLRDSLIQSSLPAAGWRCGLPSEDAVGDVRGSVSGSQVTTVGSRTSTIIASLAFSEAEPQEAPSSSWGLSDHPRVGTEEVQ